MLLKLSTKHKRLIACLIFACTVFTVCSQPLTVFAVDSIDQQEQTTENDVVSDYPQAEILELDVNDVPEQLDFNEAKEKGHVLRLREKETDDNTVIFLNDDNTETMYIFAEPIKYTDSFGEVRDKSLTLSLVEDDYTMIKNDVQVQFPNTISDGISASKDGYTVSMVPVIATSGTLTADATAALVSNKVTYANVFGTADVLYTPLYSGFKEDIILDSYNGVNEFNFFVYTNGLTPIKNENGSVSFFDPDKAEVVAEMMQVVCYDANNKFAGGDVRITEIKSNQIYAFTVIADLAFLTDEDTVYPVSVDPSLTFKGTTAIEDAVVYSGKPTKNYGNYKYATIGYLDASYKIGELLIKFPTLDNVLAVNNVTSNKIDYASLKLYTASGKSGLQNINAYYINSDSWNESTVTWNSLGHLIPPTKVNDEDIPNDGTAAVNFDITDAVKQWLNNESLATSDKGLLLANNNEQNSSHARDFICTEYTSNNVYVPYLAVKFNTVVIAHMNRSFVQLDLSENNTFDFDAYITVDTVIADTLNAFEYFSSDEDVVTINSLYGYAEAVGYGTATITAINSDYSHLIATATVCVSKYSITVGEYDPVIDNDSSELNRPLSCTLSINGQNESTNVGIEYEILSSDYGLDVSIANNTVCVNVPDTHGLAHPCGKFIVRATCEEDPAVYKDIEFTVVCNGTYNATYNYVSNIYQKFGRYIQIPFENQEGASNFSEFQTMCNTRYAQYDGEEDVSELIATDFELKNNETFWHTYDDVTQGTTYTKKLLELIRYSEVVCILSHGDGDSIQVNTGNGNIVLTVEQIEQLHDGYFNNCKLIVLLPCSNASTASGNRNIMNAFIEKGAQAVLGFNGNVNTAQAKQFEFTFWSCLRTDYSYAESGDEFADIDEIWTGNHTIQQAFNKAKQMNSSIEASFQAVLDGDGCNAYLTTD